MGTQSRLWAIVLAAGEGTRLASLTERLYGERLPKQFAVLAGHRSLLQTTIERLLPLVPASRMVVVVPLAHEGIARPQLADYPGIHIVGQPANRGTGPGVLLPLAHVLKAEPEARVVVTPSDHYIAGPEGFNDAIAAATAADSLTLVGVDPDYSETDYGWIEAGEIVGGAFGRSLGSSRNLPPIGRASSSSAVRSGTRS
jgi:mannose-1-phosphate guanylyltransferase